MSKGHNLFIAFDLGNPAETCDRLGQAIVALGIPVKIGAQLWYVDSPIGAQEAEGLLQSACNPGDTLMVIDASNNSAASHNLQPMSDEMLRTLWNGGAIDATSLPDAAATAPAAAPAEAAVTPSSPAALDAPQIAWMNRLFAARSALTGPQR